MTSLDIVGYVASVLIAISMTMSSIVRLRMIGFIGSITFSMYGLLIDSLPVSILNGFTAMTHLYYIWQMRKKSEYFEIMRIPAIDSPFLQRFIQFYNKEISCFFPDYQLDSLKNPIILLLFRDMKPASLFVAEPVSQTDLKIVIDYVIPDYRDLKSADYIFNDSVRMFSKKGYKKFIARSTVKKHQDYLKKIGFVLTSNSVFEKKI